MSAIVSFVEEADDHRLFIAAALLENGEVRFIHRKLFLPTYGLFDERRFFAAGDRLRTFDSKLGIRLGVAICEDFWHMAVPETLALDGAQMLINVSSSPGRDLAAIHEVGLGTAVSWRTLNADLRPADHELRRLLQPGRDGRDDQLLGRFGSDRPSGEAIFSAPFFDEGLFIVDIELGDVRRERIGLPLLRDERPELHLRELRRILAERTGMAVADASEGPDDEAAVGPGTEHGSSRERAER